MNRWLTALAAVVTLSLALTACGGGSTGGDASESIDPSALAGTVTYWDTSDATNEAPVFQELIA
ncbi:MAG: arabinogalactan oligomer / maltooligosaccharide transport system substrate-binding protein, partial [Actinomycetota bacterium]|nr:arabinogalactan oligomer / maltooligosaccharide transport system substrate-binding protein [Actinomycetota bacterium]